MDIMVRRLVFILGVLAIMVIGKNSLGGEPADAKKGSPPRFIIFDGFDGRLNLNWQPVRPDYTRVSLTKHRGKLTITTQRGDIHGDEKNDKFGEGIQAKNIFVIANPLAAKTDFVITTCVSGFTPTETYQQAGLIIYDDDDNYLKWGYEYNWPKNGGQTFVLVRETAAKPDHDHVDAQSGLKRYWVRIEKRKNQYEYSASTDGKTFKVYGSKTWEGKAKKIGLLAINGGNKAAAELDATFEFFELRSPSAAKME